MNGNTSATFARILLSNAGSIMLIVVLPSLRENEKKGFCCDCVVKTKAKVYNRLKAWKNM